MEIADYAYVLEHGHIAGAGVPADLLRQPHIQQAYLGIDDVAQSQEHPHGANV
jgi:ABC-type branched-subunit amino acid transport system ATPase component